MSAQMGNFDIKDGEYTKTIYTMIKEQRYKLLLFLKIAQCNLPLRRTWEKCMLLTTYYFPFFPDTRMRSKYCPTFTTHIQLREQLYHCWPIAISTLKWVELLIKEHKLLNFFCTRSSVYKQPKKIATSWCCLNFGQISLVWLLICCLKFQRSKHFESKFPFSRENH